MKNKIRSKSVALLMAIATIANVGTINVSACEMENNSTTELHSRTNEVEEAIELLDSYITVEKNDDGINVFVLDVPENVKSDVDTDLFTILVNNMNSVNEEAVDEEIIITDNGTVYNDTDEYVLQGGNIDQYKEYWWGSKRWACRDCAVVIQDEFNKVSTGFWAGASIGGVIASVTGPIGAGIVIGSTYEAAMFGWCATDIGETLRDNPDSGIILKMAPFFYSVDAQ